MSTLDTTLAAPSPPSATERLVSIDALRGFDMFWIIGGREFVLALIAFLGFKGDPISRQLQHPAWEGFTFFDLIFPLFLFLVGAALPFSIGKARQTQASMAALHLRIFRRTLLLFALGLIVNRNLDLDPANFRLLGVLQRIALTYCVAALLVVHTSVRSQALAAAVLLLGYWAVVGLIAAPGSVPGDFTPAGCLPGYIDRQFLPGKHDNYGYGDNEGILATFPAIASVLLGVLAGHWLRSPRSPWTKAGGLALAGVVSLAVGSVWGMWFPIIKNIWTSSFVLVAGGWSLLLLAIFYTLIDVLGYKKWAFFFVVIGVNAITIYVGRRIVNFSFTANFLLGGAARHLGGSGPLILAAAVLGLEWLVLFVLYRARIFLRL